MKILIITPSACMGGTERYVLNFLTIFGESLDIDTAFYNKIDEKVINKIKLKSKDVLILPYYVKHPIKFICEMINLYKKKNYDYVYIHSNHALAIVYAFPVWFSKQTKILFHSHNSENNNRLLQIIFRHIINLVSYKEFACSENASQFMYGHRNAIIVNNGINLYEYRYDYNIRKNYCKQYYLENNFVIGHVGKFDKQKNHEFLIQVFREIVNMRPNSKLILIGEGELKHKIIQIVDEYNLSDKVIFIGNTERVNEFYNCFDLFLLPSLYEGFPFVGVEAQASGTTCIFSDTITKKIAITPLVHFMSLRRTPKEWADYALSLYLETKTKKDYINDLQMRGYGLEKIESIYTKEGLF